MNAEQRLLAYLEALDKLAHEHGLVLKQGEVYDLASGEHFASGLGWVDFGPNTTPYHDADLIEEDGQ